MDIEHQDFPYEYDTHGMIGKFGTTYNLARHTFAYMDEMKSLRPELSLYIVLWYMSAMKCFFLNKYREKLEPAVYSTNLFWPWGFLEKLWIISCESKGYCHCWWLYYFCTLCIKERIISDVGDPLTKGVIVGMFVYMLTSSVVKKWACVSRWSSPVSCLRLKKLLK